MMPVSLCIDAQQHIFYKRVCGWRKSVAIVLLVSLKASKTRYGLLHDQNLAELV